MAANRRKGKRARTAALLGACALLAGAAPAGATHRAPIWADAFDGGDRDWGEGIALSPDGTTVLATGFAATGPPDYSADIATIASDAQTGARRWSARYDGPAHGADLVARRPGIVASPDGTRVYVAGSSEGSATGYDLLLIAYDATSGALAWVARHDAGLGADEFAASLAIAPDGSRIYLTGWGGKAAGTGKGSDFLTVAYDAAGALVWADRYSGTAAIAPHGPAEQPTAVLATRDGSRVLVTGTGERAAGVFEVITVAHDAATGMRTWVRRGPDGAGHALAGGSDGRAYLAGQSGGDFLAVALDVATAATQWTATYDGPGPGGEDGAYLVTLSPDGSRVYVGGAAFDDSTGYDPTVLAYASASGAVLWTAALRDPDDGRPGDLEAAANGAGVYLAGEVDRGFRSDWLMFGVDASTGAIAWSASYNRGGEQDETALALALNPDASRVYVVGVGHATTELDSADLVTLAFDPGSTTCASDRDEEGIVSGPLHQQVEPAAGPAGPVIHQASCDQIVPRGL